MAEKPITIKDIVALKKENEELQELITFLQKGIFEYTLKCNRIENSISNMMQMISKEPGKLVEASENLYHILQGSENATNNMLGVRISNKAIKFNNQLVEECPKISKAHVVKPHMVNGTVLHIPTINLTRVSNSDLQSTSKQYSQRDEESDLEMISESNTLRNAVVESDESFTSQIDGDQEFSTNNSITHLEDLSDPSTSATHSTVLSGTFQEVKIYLNQISQESHNEPARRPVTTRKRSSGGVKRGTENVTKRMTRNRRN